MALDRLHPAVFMTYFLAVMVIAMFVSDPVIGLCALLCGILFCSRFTRGRERISDLLFYVPMFLLIAVTNPLFSHNGVTPLFFLNGNPVTMEAFVYGAAIAVMLIAVMLWGKGCSEVMTSDKWLCLLGRPAPKLSLVLSMALRFIPLFKRRMKRVSAAQKAMGLYASSGVTDRVHSALRVFAAMVAWSFENAMETAASMKARGYGLPGRTHFSLCRFRAADAAVLCFTLPLFAAVVTGAACGVVGVTYYPRIIPPRTTPAAILCYAAYLTLCLLPWAIEVKEAMVWKYSVSKI